MENNRTHDTLDQHMGKILALVAASILFQVTAVKLENTSLLIQAAHLLTMLGLVLTIRRVKLTWDSIALLGGLLGGGTMLVSGTYSAIIAKSLPDIFAVFSNTVIAVMLDALLAGFIWIIIQKRVLNTKDYERNTTSDRQ